MYIYNDAAFLSLHYDRLCAFIPSRRSIKDTSRGEIQIDITPLVPKTRASNDNVSDPTSSDHYK